MTTTTYTPAQIATIRARHDAGAYDVGPDGVGYMHVDGEWISATDVQAILDGGAPVTDAQIRALRIEAGAAGDLDQITLCSRALGGDASARAQCQDAIDSARAMADGLVAELRQGTWTVSDGEGGVWWPRRDKQDRAADEIAAAEDPAATALAMCRSSPLRGTWID